MKKEYFLKIGIIFGVLSILARLLMTTAVAAQSQRYEAGLIFREGGWKGQNSLNRLPSALVGKDIYIESIPPADFEKVSPYDGTTDLYSSVTLEWESSSDAGSYEYCIDTTDDDTCPDENWVSTGIADDVALSGLSIGTTYYWQVRARNTDGTTQADGGSWWHFTTVMPPPPDPPGNFAKISPTTGATNLWDPTLNWSVNPDAGSYEYCIDTTDDDTCLDENWVSTGIADDVALSGLSSGTTYYWQVRARNTDGTTQADGGSWWHFTTVFPPLPSPTYSKKSPFSGTENLDPSSITLEWYTTTGAESYEYCVDTTDDNGCSDWVSTGTAVEVNPPGLSKCTIYYWQVRARNISGTTEPEGGYWHFTTLFIPEPSPTYSKKSPFSGTENLDPSSITLKWGITTGAESYEYCIDTTDDNTCPDENWVSTGSETEVTLSELALGTTYYWQVRARNACGTTEPEEGYWDFTTMFSLAPGSLSKTSPSDGATNLYNPTLAWESSSDADSYEYCIDTTDDNTCSDDNWISTGTATEVALSGLSAGTTYYWQVSARNTGGTTQADGGSWWHFTTEYYKYYLPLMVNE
jgi:hypothetical protein